MKIVQERIDRENYLELSLTHKEFEIIKEYMIICKKCSIQGFETNVGVKLEIEAEGDEDLDEIFL